MSESKKSISRDARPVDSFEGREGRWFLTLGLVFAFVLVAVQTFTSSPAKALSQPLSQLEDTSVSCGATGDPEVIQPTGPVSSICVENTSATCVQVGGSGVTTTTGIAIGSGCSGGQVFCADVKRLWCESTSGSVTVDVVYGAM